MPKARKLLIVNMELSTLFPSIDLSTLAVGPYYIFANFGLVLSFD